MVTKNLVKYHYINYYCVSQKKKILLHKLWIVIYIYIYKFMLLGTKNLVKTINKTLKIWLAEIKVKSRIDQLHGWWNQ